MARSSWGLVVLLLLAAAPARGERGWWWLEAEAGYSTITPTEQASFFHGWGAAVAWTTRSGVALLAEGDGIYSRGGESLHTMLFGPRAAVGDKGFSVFAEMLFGAAAGRYRWDTGLKTEWHPGFAAGGGIEIDLTHTVSLRVIDARYLFAGTSLVQLTARLVIRWGRPRRPALPAPTPPGAAIQPASAPRSDLTL